MRNFSNPPSVSDVSAAEALLVAACECTSDSHLNNSFIGVALLRLLESLQEMICWQECLQPWDRRWLVVLCHPWSRSLQSLVVPAGLRGTGWDSTLPCAVPASGAMSRPQCSQGWCSQDRQQSLGVVALTKGKGLSG